MRTINQDFEKALKVLEDAHLVSQPYAWAHTKVHLQMLILAFKYKVWREFFGQMPRILLAAPGSLFGKAPKGNIGSTKMGIFEER